jgi:plastocyanin
MIRHYRIGLLGLTLLGLGIACFSEHTAPTADNSALCDNPSGSVVNGSTLVTIRSFAFETQNVQVATGGSVTWVNCESSATSHTSTSDQGVWSSPLIAPGDAFTETFDTPGVYSYHCTPHPFMTGTVTVQ